MLKPKGIELLIVKNGTLTILPKKSISLIYQPKRYLSTISTLYNSRAISWFNTQKYIKLI